jgi:hypothetical protein
LVSVSLFKCFHSLLKWALTQANESSDPFSAKTIRSRALEPGTMLAPVGHRFIMEDGEEIEGELREEDDHGDEINHGISP